MEKYIKHLIADLKIAAENAPVHKTPEEMSENEFMDNLEEIDRIVTSDPKYNMYDVFGLESDIFPPVEKLTTKQAISLADEILQLWEAYYIESLYPEDFPMEKLYPLLIAKFKEPFLYFPMGITGVEFCEYEPSECPFGEEYCMCKDEIDDYQIEDMFNENNNQSMN